jgi:hypothetical protein
MLVGVAIFIFPSFKDVRVVLEHLFPQDWLERRVRYAFLLAVVYSIISLLAARLIFPENAGIVSVILVSLLLLPSMGKLLAKEERRELKEHRFTLRRFFIDNRDAIKVYLALFFGVYLTYAICSFLLPQFGFSAGAFLPEQLAPDSGLRGSAFSAETFLSLFLNNWWVLLACFLFAFIAGDGALFFIVWNASSWGAIFGLRAYAASLSGVAFNPWVNLAIILVVTLPHVFLEGGAYILAAIAGGVLSDAVVSKRKAMVRFLPSFLFGAVIFAAATYLFQRVFVPVIAGFLQILVALLLLRMLGSVFNDQRHREVFAYNYTLFLFAVVVFLVAVLVETLVLGSSELLRIVYAAVQR